MGAHYPLPIDKVLHVGKGVALVIAATPDQASDAAERIAVEYEPLAVATASAEAVSPGAPRLWDEAPGNIAFDSEIGDQRAVEEAFAHKKGLNQLAFLKSAAARRRRALPSWRAFDVAQWATRSIRVKVEPDLIR